jgi:ankyrin repeat protein
LQVALNWDDAESEFFLKDAIALHETLFQYKVHPNIRNWAGDTALYAAVDNGHNNDIVSLFLGRGADINVKGFNARTALHRAASRDLIDLSDRPTHAPSGQTLVAS